MVEFHIFRRSVGGNDQHFPHTEGTREPGVSLGTMLHKQTLDNTR